MCSVMQCVAKYCSVLQRVSIEYIVLQCVAVCRSVLQCVAVCCGAVQYVTMRHNVLHALQGSTLCCSMQRVAVCCIAI